MVARFPSNPRMTLSHLESGKPPAPPPSHFLLGTVPQKMDGESFLCPFGKIEGPVWFLQTPLFSSTNGNLGHLCGSYWLID